MNTADQWGLRSILGPVLTRLIIYGTHPVDVEHAIQFVENAPMRNALDLERNWASVWEKRAEKYLALAKKAYSNNHKEKMLRLATQCFYATFLINYNEHKTKVALYKQYADHYEACSKLNHNLKKIKIELTSEKSIEAHLHTPAGQGTYPTVLVLAGLGSCKEEMDIFVQPLIERGIAALVPDLPGCGSSIYGNDIKCRMGVVEETISQLVSYAKTDTLIDKTRLGTAGLCMGGGLAYKAAANHDELQFAATLFPLLIDQVSDDMVPAWMKSGKWFELISGMDDSAAFIKEMGLKKSEVLSADFLMIHSEHDNWMTLEMAQEVLFNRATGKKELIVVSEEPVLTSKDAVTHSMPVGEQMHWSKEVLADWIAQTVAGLPHA